MTGYFGFSSSIILLEIKEKETGKSKYSSLNNFFNFGFELFSIYSNKPLITAVKVGMLVFMLSFIYLIYIIVCAILYGVNVDGYASMMSVV